MTMIHQRCIDYEEKDDTGGGLGGDKRDIGAGEQGLGCRPAVGTDIASTDSSENSL